MKLITTTAALCLLTASASISQAKTINLRLHLNVDSDTVTEVEAVKSHVATTSDDDSAATIAKLTRGHFSSSSSKLTKAWATPEDGKIQACESVTEQRWVKELNYACSWGNQQDGFDSVYKLKNGTIFTAELCDQSDKAALDKVFFKAMNGTALSSKLYDDLQCYSKQHATYSVDNTMLPFDSEFNYVIHQFAEMVEDDDDSEDSDEDSDNSNE
ncbi:hypothetical protein Gpo141_00009763 [Globisporangium polare]